MNKNLHPLNVALPYFKVLLASDEYRKYCIAKIAEDNAVVSKLRKKHPNLEKIWHFWGDIYSFDRRLNEVKYFKQWLELNISKFHRIKFNKIEVIRAGDKIVAEEGVLYCAVSGKVDRKTAVQLYHSTRKELVSVANKAAGEYVLALNKNVPFSASKAAQFEREVDVIYWKRFLGLTSVQVAFRAYRKKKPAWDEFRATVRKCAMEVGAKRLKDLDRETMNSAIRSIDRLNKSGEKRIRSLLNDEFSFPEEASPV